MINVLIVEDDPMVAFINQQYLKNMSEVNVIGVTDTENGVLKILEKEKVDLILLDVFLPKKSGIEILKSLREKKYLTDVIMITAANNPEDIKIAIAYGAVDYLIKPFEFERFEEAINGYKVKRDILNRTVSLNQEEIDKIYSKPIDEINNLPKGLNKLTLNKIIKFLTDNDKEWTLREIATEINISNVTIKKYMDYLQSINKVGVEVSSGNVGRPEFKYKLK